VPSQAPTSKDLLAKPDTTTFCPASGKKLRLKDCVAVRFTRAPEGEAQAGASSSGQAGSSSSGLYMDPVTMDTFTNASKLVVIAPTGAWAVGGWLC
jgi:nitric oxide synthase-interacting protein